jgi:hypothetical protein
MRHRLKLSALTAALAMTLTILATVPAGAVQVAHDRIVSANPSDITPNVIHPEHAGFQVFTLAEIGDRVYAAGDFTQIQNAGGGPIFTTSGLFAFDRTTGQIDTTGFGFPVVNGRIEVLTPSEDGQALFVGGNFSQVNGRATKKLAKLDPSTGAVITAFKGKADKKVNDLVARGGLLYLGGTFGLVNGTPRSGIAAVDPVTGALSSELNLPVTGTRRTTKAMHVDRIDVSSDASKLLISGNFTQVNGVSRDQIALIDLTGSPDTLSTWQTSRFQANCASRFDTYIRDVDFAPDGSYFVVTTTGASAIIFGATPLSGPLCDATVRYESGATGSGQQPTWITFTGGDTNYSVVATGTAIYMGGHQRWQNNYWGRDSAGPGAVSRAGIAAISPLNGMPFAWNPGRTRGLGAQSLLATNDGLYVGSDTDTIGNEFHAKLALMPLEGGQVVPAANPGTLPGELYTVEQDGDMVARSFDGTNFGPATPRTALNWSGVRGAFMLSGNLYTGLSDGTLRDQTLNGDSVGIQRTINLRGLETETQQAPNMATQLAGATGMFWDRSNGRLYYTVTGDVRLYYRNFNPENDLMGDYRFTACTWSANAGQNTCGGLNPSIVRGMTLVSGEIYFGQANGNLSRVPFTSGTVVTSFGSIGATATAISGPGIDGRDWNSRALFVRSDA